MPSPHERTGRALELLAKGLSPYFCAEMQAAFRDDWIDVARASFRQDRTGSILTRLSPEEWDSQALLTVMWDQWNAVFRNRLGLFERSLVSELREFRNRWAHQSMLADDDSYRVADSVQRLLGAIEGDQTILIELEALKVDIMRDRLKQLVEEDVERSWHNRTKLIEVGIYALCGVTICSAAAFFLGPKNALAAVLLGGFSMLAFIYLAVTRLRTSRPVHGVHECAKCQKVIYTEVCPYCEAPVPSSSIIRRGSSLRYPPFTSPSPAVEPSASSPILPGTGTPSAR